MDGRCGGEEGIYAHGSAWDEGNMVQAMARMNHTERRSEERGEVKGKERKKEKKLKFDQAGLKP